MELCFSNSVTCYTAIMLNMGIASAWYTEIYLHNLNSNKVAKLKKKHLSWKHDIKNNITLKQVDSENDTTAWL